MATFTVITAADVVNPSDGVLSLREAVARANADAGADTINFAAAIEGQTRHEIALADREMPADARAGDLLEVFAGGEDEVVQAASDDRG